MPPGSPTPASVYDAPRVSLRASRRTADCPRRDADNDYCCCCYCETNRREEKEEIRELKSSLAIDMERQQQSGGKNNKTKTTRRASLVESLVRRNRVRFPLNEIGIDSPFFVLPFNASLLHYTAQKQKKITKTEVGFIKFLYWRLSSIVLIARDNTFFTFCCCHATRWEKLQQKQPADPG